MLRRLVATLIAGMFCLIPLAWAAPITFSADLSGAAEDPPNASPASGQVTVIFDMESHTLRVIASFQDLIGTTVASHIHCCTADPFAGNVGVATMVPSFAGFPLGVTSGTFDQTYDTTLAASFNPAFVTSHGGDVGAAELALFTALQEGRAYFNIHTTAFPPGEIRGFPQQKVPEPGTLALVSLALVALPFARRTRQRAA